MSLQANVFFLDEPIGVGFSHADNDQVSFSAVVKERHAHAYPVDCWHHRRSRNRCSSLRFHCKVMFSLYLILVDRLQFFETFKEFEGRAFHMAGESYGGRYLPIFASAVVDGNKQLIKEGKSPINLNSVMIGNGVTDYCEYYFRDAGKC